MNRALFPVVVFVTCLIPFPAISEDFDDLPWELRPYFEFTVGSTSLRYAGDNAEWHLFHNGVPFVEKARMEVRLADGRTFDTSTVGKGSESRSRSTSAQGDGVEYLVELPIPDAGISVEHAFFVNNERAFYTVRTRVKNIGAEPVSIERVSPVILPPGSFSALSPNTTLRRRPLEGRGAWPVYAGDSGSLSVGLFDGSTPYTFVMGPLPVGPGASTVQMDKGSEGWQGRIDCAFSPPVRLDPGDVLKVDPVWMSCSVPDPGDVELLFAWSHAERPRAEYEGDLPEGWVTMPPYAEWRQVQSAQRAWSSVGVAHVRVPLGWESTPGSLEGGGSGYPKNMASVARSIRVYAGIPGLTVDPMSAPEGNGAWSARSDDGQLWVDLQDPAAFQSVVARLREIDSWGFDFYVVPETIAPDEILQHFRMTRREAQFLGMKAMEAAAPGKPVYPAPVAAIANDERAWLEADDATRRMNDYRLPMGPVQLDPAYTGSYDSAIVTAIREFDGPIEFVGTPSARVRNSLAGLFDTDVAREMAKRIEEAEEEFGSDEDQEERNEPKKKKFWQRIPGLGGGDK